MASETENKRVKVSGGTVLAGIIVTGLAIAATVLGFKPIGLQSDVWTKVGQVVAILGVVAVVIERAVEVYVSKRYDMEKFRLNRPITRAKTKLMQAEKAWNEERERRQGSLNQQDAESNQVMTTLQKNIEVANEFVDKAEEGNWLAISKMQRLKLRDASFLSVVFGFAVALSGVRVLGPLVKIESSVDNNMTWQIGLFQTVDTLLTGLVLAGGAAGVHAMFSALKTFKPTS